MDLSTFTANSLEAIAGLLLLFFGGEVLVRGAAALAMRLGISPLAVGLTVVAFGTSAPELAVSLDAAMAGANDIAIGNVVGSNIANVALILGVAALIRPISVEPKAVRLDAPLMILCTLVLLAVLRNGVIGRLEGMLLLSGLTAYVAFTLWQARGHVGESSQGGGDGLPTSLVLITLGLGGIVLGGHLMVEASIDFALAFGVSHAVIGLTVVAVGTSLPELATSVVAGMRGQGDIAVGNIIGSNIFNILGIVGVTATVTPLTRGAVDWTSLAVMLGAAVVLLPLMLTQHRLARSEGAGLLLGYAAYIYWLVV